MILSVHQPQYIPWLGFFEKIAESDSFVFLDCVQYKEREFQNRNKIHTKDGWIWLSVPVISKGLGRQLMNDVLIDNERPWRKQHGKSLRTWYGKAQFFDTYMPFFEATYAQEWERLSALNTHVIRFVLRELGISTPLYFESSLDIHTLKSERIIDICKKLKADTYLSGIGGKEYLDEAKFKDNGITVRYQEFKHPVYTQQFMKHRDDFMPYMSILDLLFNEGPRSRDILLNNKEA